MNRTTSAPISVLSYDVDKGLELHSRIQHLPFLVVPNKSQKQELNHFCFSIE